LLAQVQRTVRPIAHGISSLNEECHHYLTLSIFIYRNLTLPSIPLNYQDKSATTQTPVTAFTRSGDNGSARKRLPVNLNTALPTQGATSGGKFVARGAGPSFPDFAALNPGYEAKRT
jgi:hypothetical protein